jgi:hypothetical protein
MSNGEYFFLLEEHEVFIETCISIGFISFTAFMDLFTLDLCDYEHDIWFSYGCIL